MDQSVRARFHDGILQTALQYYGIAAGQARPLAAFESFIYAFERDARGYILRIGHTLRKSAALVQGEIDWINYLAAGGVSVARAIPSQAGRWVETIDDGQGGQFLVTGFVRAPGRSPWDLGWTPGLVTTYGQTLGNMHALTRHYQPAEQAWRRPAWDDASMEFVERYLPTSESVAKQKYQEVRAHLHTLPQEAGVYGLIHQDAHGSNFLVDEAGALTFFDFDDCAYSWYANDLAIALFYSVTDAEAPAEFVQEFMPPFLTGYRRAYRLEARWLAEFPVFLKAREIELYAAIHRDFDVAHIDDAWCARFMHGRKERIEQAAPYLDFDFTTLAAYL